MEKNTASTFSILDVETVESTDFASSWEIKYRDKIKTRKYGAKPFSNKRNAIFEWIGKNRKEIRNLTFEQQEEMMIKDGVLTRDDI
ncbi:MAG: hypothetical protein NC452_17195 [Eubacterium sp.]|nr:hypothetical protein [Eubacterium sp.]